MEILMLIGFACLVGFLVSLFSSKNNRQISRHLLPKAERAARPFYNTDTEELKSKTERTLTRLDKPLKMVRLYNEALAVLKEFFPSEHPDIVSAHFVDLHAFANEYKIAQPDGRSEVLSNENEYLIGCVINRLSLEAYTFVKDERLDHDFKQKIHAKAYEIFLVAEQLIFELDQRNQLLDTSRGPLRIMRDKIFRYFPHIASEFKNEKDYKKIFTALKQELVLHEIISGEPYGI